MVIPQRIKLLRWYQGEYPPGKSTPLEIVMIQPSPFCNIDCKYCYLPNRSDTSRVDLSLVEGLIEKIASSGLFPREFSMVWHAGEPLVLGVEFFKEAFQRVSKILPQGVTAVHHIQTNGMLISRPFCELFKNESVRVSLSIDGPAFLHDQNRKTRGGSGTHAAAMRGLALLREYGLDPPIIAVLTNDSLVQAEAIYGFFRENKITSFGFNIDELEGHNTTSSFIGAVDATYEAFVTRILELCDRDENLLGYREFRNVFDLPGIVLGRRVRGNSESNPLSIISMDVSGRIFTFSPELVDLKSPHGADYSIGHVDNIDFTKLFAEPAFLGHHQEIQAGIRACQGACRYFDRCGGGAPVNKLYENGSFNSTETIFCRFTRQLTIDAVDRFVANKIIAGFENRRSPRPQVSKL